MGNGITHIKHVFRCSASSCTTEVLPWEPLCAPHRTAMLSGVDVHAKADDLLDMGSLVDFMPGADKAAKTEEAA